MPFLPLEGRRVVDVTTSIAGPFCAEILGALGADVVKVERPDTGDDGRAWGPPFWNGESAMFLSGQRRQALAGGLARATSAGAKPCSGSPAGADVFLQSLRPGLADRLGLGVECGAGPEPEDRLLHDRRLRTRRPAARRAGLRRAHAGRGRAHQHDRGAGTPRCSRRLVAHRHGYGHVGCARDRRGAARAGANGEGTVVDTSLYETALGYIGYHLVGYLADGTVPVRPGNRLPDGRALPGLPDQGRRADGRGRQRPAVRRALRGPRAAASSSTTRASARTRTACGTGRRSWRFSRSGCASGDTSHWHDALTRAGVPAAPVADVADVAASEQTAALEILQPRRASDDSGAHAARPSRCRSPETVRSIGAHPARRRAHGRGAARDRLRGGRDRRARG